MRVRDDCYTQNHLSVIIEVVQVTIKERKGDFVKANKFAHTYEVDV